MSSNLPPGCTSPDGGIDHELEAAWEKAYEIADKAGLTAADLLLVMEQGVKLIQVVHVEGEKAFRMGFEYGGYHAMRPMFWKKFDRRDILDAMYGRLELKTKKVLWGEILFEVIAAGNEESFRFGFKEGEFSKRHEMEERDNE